MAEIRPIIFGATGTAGSAVLDACLNSDQVGPTLVIARRSTGVTHHKLTEILHDDFAELSSLQDALTGQNACIYCLGVSQTKVKDEDLFFKITHDYPLAAASLLHNMHPEFVFCFLSGQGADRSMKSRIRFARAKGAAENSLISLGMQHLYIFRPGYIHPEDSRRSRPVGERISGLLYPVLRRVVPKFMITARVLAKGMLSAVILLPSQQLYHNEDIKQLAGKMP